MGTPGSLGAATGLFALDHVSVQHDRTLVLDDVCAEIPASGITAVVGPSGAGKSTLLRLCNRLEVPTTGTVAFRDRDLTALDPLELRRRVGMVFQRPTLFPGTVRDNLAVAAPDGDDDRYVAALQAAALDPSLLDRDADRLSGGEAQRACLARTLVVDCEALLLDEPTSALDAGPKRAFERLAIDLAAQGMPMIWVTHELPQVRRVADRVLALLGGRLVHAGTLEGLHHVPTLAAFLSDQGGH